MMLAPAPRFATGPRGIGVGGRKVARPKALLQFWRLLNDKSLMLPRDRIPRLARHRLVLKLRALDARLAGETYREIALVLLA
jgi:hypothetical protein